MRKVILFGCSGMLGNYVFHVLQNHHYVHCFAREDFDIMTSDWPTLEKRITNLLDKDDYVINCAGVIPQKNSRASHFRIVNTEFPQQLSSVCSRNGHRLIHVSTNCVFGGDKGNYDENSRPDSLTPYGLSKAAGEPLLALVLRTSIVGEEKRAQTGLLEWVKQGEGQLDGFVDQHWNGVTCLSLAKYIKSVLDEPDWTPEIRHIYSKETVSKAELCAAIVRVYDLTIKVRPIESHHPKDCTLSGKVRVEQTIEAQIAEQREFGMHARADSRSLFAQPSAYLTMNYYLIHNLDAARKARMLEEFRRFGVDNNYVKWILYPNKTEIDQYGHAHRVTNGMSRGYIACTYKHYLALGDMVEKMHPRAVVMEDNMEFTCSIPYMLSRWLFELRSADWSVLFDSNILEYKEAEVTPSTYVYPKSNEVTGQCHGGSRGASFYMVNLQAARQLHENFLPFEEAVDHWYNILFRKLGLKSFWTQPPNALIAKHDSCA